VSSALDVESHQYSTGIGTPLYMSPEQKEGEGDYDMKTDMYSFGIILFEIFYEMDTDQERYKLINFLRDNQLVMDMAKVKMDPQIVQII
jgi:serine/threonine protein kinase